MKRSLALSLYLRTVGRGDGAPAVARPVRPEGALLWAHAGGGASARSLGQLLDRIARDRADLSILVTSEGSLDADAFIETVLIDAAPADQKADVEGFLDHWRPDLFLLTGSSLPPVTIVALHDRDIPAILADARVPAQSDWSGLFRRGMVASLLSRFTRILAQDGDSARRLHKIIGAGAQVEVAGRIEESSDPLTCNEVERAELAEVLRARPVWLAAACPEAEEMAVLAAHAHALRLAHRMLLILSPADAQRAGVLAARCQAEGWGVARWAEDEAPDDEVQVLVTDGEADMGLWYRLAPVSFMGGTLVPGGGGRNPYEPAALGSAILHGPEPGPYPDAYARLAEAGAARRVADGAGLSGAVADLIAPDKAALLAHNAWVASSGGAEVTERIARIILSCLDRAPSITDAGA